jgi:hypothetical protein
LSKIHKSLDRNSSIWARILSIGTRNSRTWAIYEVLSLVSRFVHITWLSWSRFSSFSCAGKKKFAEGPFLIIHRQRKFVAKSLNISNIGEIELFHLFVSIIYIYKEESLFVRLSVMHLNTVRANAMTFCRWYPLD